ncbi:MAG: diguanylate cyclase [Sedimenticola sp.]|nr:diguanylate cyclase [Sedimenticola sp.]
MSQSENELKKRYLDCLDDLERKERRWQSVESTLRKCISRLSFVGDGLDPQMDQQLEQLRNRVRGEQDIKALLSLVEAINRRAEKVSGVVSSAQPAATSMAVPILNRLLSQATLPEGLQKRAARLHQCLQQDSPAEKIVEEATQLILEALRTVPGTAGGERAGLIGKLFSKEKGGAQQAAPAGAAGPGTDKADIGDARQLLLFLLEQLRERVRGSDGLMPSVREADSREALQQVAAELAKLIPPIEGSDQGDSRPEPGQVLLQLLERLDIPAELQSRSQALRQRLMQRTTAENLPPLLNELVALVEHARTQAERERQEVERFLMQMTDQLQALDREVSGIGETGREISAGNARIDREMQNHVSRMQESVDQAHDLGDLKNSINQRLLLIQERLRGHRDETERLVQGFEERIDLLNSKLGDMEQETADLRQCVEKARAEAFTDALTGLHNRHAFDSRLDEEFSRWNRYRNPLCLIVVDVDHFKRVNDTYGHLAGDKVLQVIGSHLKRATRKVDFAARYGGEEFVILLPEVNLKGARAVAEKIRTAIEEKPFHSGNNRVSITVSCGVASFREGDGRKTPFERADEALYLAKRSGRNRCCTEQQLRPER